MAWLLPLVGALVIKLLCLTWRLRVKGPPPVFGNTPLIFCLWHGRQAALFAHPRPRHMAVLTSLSRDGQIQARIAVPVLVRDVQKKESRKRGYALYALRSMGDAAAPAVPALLRMLEDEREASGLRVQALGVLANTRGKGVLAALERVRERHRGLPRCDPALAAFLDGIDRTIALVRKREQE